MRNWGRRESHSRDEGSVTAPGAGSLFEIGDAVMKIPRTILVFVGVLASGAFASARAAEIAPQTEPASSYYRSAVQGSADAQARLGGLYAAGTGVEQSYAAAIQWYMRAAEQGHGESQLRLAEIWANGLGVPRNDALAYRWALLAKSNAGGEADIRDKSTALLGRLEARLSTEQVAEARHWAAQWKPQLEVASPDKPRVVAQPDKPAPTTEPEKPVAKQKKTRVVAKPEKVEKREAVAEPAKTPTTEPDKTPPVGPDQILPIGEPETTGRTARHAETMGRHAETTRSIHIAQSRSSHRHTRARLMALVRKYVW